MPSRGHQHAFDLLRVNIHAADDQHVIRAARDAVEAAVCPAAGARLGDHGRDVAGAIAEQGHGFPAQRGHDQFAGLAVGQRARRSAGR